MNIHSDVWTNQQRFSCSDDIMRRKAGDQSTIFEFNSCLMFFYLMAAAVPSSSPIVTKANPFLVMNKSVTSPYLANSCSKVSLGQFSLTPLTKSLLFPPLCPP